jgi:hypothetical protein
MAELTPLVEAWIRYAEDDWQDSQILASAGRNGRSICFHVQQCIEKLFKAELMRMALPVPKTHNLKHPERHGGGSTRPKIGVGAMDEAASES